MSEGGIECPEHFCGDIWYGREELESHLRWDHNRSEYEAEKLADQAIDTDSDRTRGESQ